MSHWTNDPSRAIFGSGAVDYLSLVHSYTSRGDVRITHRGGSDRQGTDAAAAAFTQTLIAIRLVRVCA